MRIKAKIYSAVCLAALIIVQTAQVLAQVPHKKTPEISGAAKLSKLKLAVEANPNDMNAIQAYYDTFLEVKPGHEKELASQIRAWSVRFPSGYYFPAYLKRAAKLAARTTDPAALEKLKKAVEAAPDSLNRHQAYIEAIGPDNPEIITRYNVLMKEFPQSAIIPYALAKAYIDKESPKARPYLLKAVEINPKFAPAWYGLWVDDLRWGNFEEGWEYLRKAIAADPSNPEYQYRYATSFMGLDQQKFADLSFKIARDFPDSEYAIRALGYLAACSGTTQLRIKCYQMLHDDFPKEKTEAYMSSYFDVLLAANPEKARELAMEMKLVNSAEWSDLLTQAESFIQGKKLMDQNQPAEALAILNKIKLARYSAYSKERLLLLKAEATDQTGNHFAAYDMLMRVFVKDPSPELSAALYAYGAKSGKNDAAVKTDIYAELNADAKAATPFSLKKYIGEGKASLADYKGKVLLLTYWFPGCGPCRAEMPFFENVVKQYKSRPLAYVGINIVPEQDEYVIPFHNSSGFSFTPLAELKGRDKGNLDNQGSAPTNFLLDQNGRIIFSDFSIHAENETHLKMMIDLLLDAPADFMKQKS
ncbi:redoxin family protein [Mucilaginibacter ximonensis]|uniref:Redoxin family protein n=1 Tax=Mucilaginibacter ximonensis TaxID=538021 RepID=A0ABW5Y8U6_9SPHI